MFENQQFLLKIKKRMNIIFSIINYYFLTTNYLKKWRQILKFFAEISALFTEFSVKNLKKVFFVEIFNFVAVTKQSVFCNF
jgi:hypothetical protein